MRELEKTPAGVTIQHDPASGSYFVKWYEKNAQGDPQGFKLEVSDKHFMTPRLLQEVADLLINDGK